jgi:hypothetical protein
MLQWAAIKGHSSEEMVEWRERRRLIRIGETFDYHLINFRSHSLQTARSAAAITCHTALH